jgi:hypothetical protein
MKIMHPLKELNHLDIYRGEECSSAIINVHSFIVQKHVADCGAICCFLLSVQMLTHTEKYAVYSLLPAALYSVSLKYLKYIPKGEINCVLFVAA